MKLALITVGQCFGDDDIINERNYKATMTCTKNDSFLYVISRADFLRFFGKNSEAWKNVKWLSAHKSFVDFRIQSNFKVIT